MLSKKEGAPKYKVARHILFVFESLNKIYRNTVKNHLLKLIGPSPILNFIDNVPIKC